MIEGYGNDDGFMARILGGEITGLKKGISEQEMEGSELFQNYPNPFNKTTRIDYKLIEKDMVYLEVYNALGEKIRKLVNEKKEKGMHSMIFDSGELPPGIYYYRLKASKLEETKKMIIMR